MKQTRVDSFMEAVTNTLIGFVISLITQVILARVYHIPMSWGTMLQVVGWFTIVSVARQYILRRLFNGRTVWQSIRRKY